MKYYLLTMCYSGKLDVRLVEEGDLEALTIETINALEKVSKPSNPQKSRAGER